MNLGSELEDARLNCPYLTGEGLMLFFLNREKKSHPAFPPLAGYVDSCRTHTGTFMRAICKRGGDTASSIQKLENNKALQQRHT